MSDSGKPNKTTPKSTTRSSEVLSSLPSTRPQRLTARRVATRKRTLDAQETATTDQPGTTRTAKTPKPTVSRGAKPKASKTQPSSPPRRASATTKKQATVEPAPRQGFESNSEIPLGVSIDPPSRGEIITSAVDLVGTLAQSGVSLGSGAVKSLLGRLPGH